MNVSLLNYYAVCQSTCPSSIIVTHMKASMYWSEEWVDIMKKAYNKRSLQLYYAKQCKFILVEPLR